VADGLSWFDPNLQAYTYPVTNTKVEVFGGGVIKMSLHTSGPPLRKVPKFTSIEEADRWLDGE
jgi:hypothetical protein